MYNLFVVHTDPPQDDKNLNLAIFLPNLDGGGAQKATARLANALVKKNVRVTLLASRGGGVVSGMLDAGIRIVAFNSSRVLFSVPGVVRFLNQNRPDILLSIQTNANLSAIISRLFSYRKTRLIVSERSSYTTRVKGRDGVKARLMVQLVPLLYRFADLVTSVSAGVADDLQGYIRNREIVPLYNPVVDNGLLAQTKKEVDEPWLRSHGRPVILAVGRLGPEKDYPTLLKALKLMREKAHARLIILGEGRERANLEKMIASLGLEGAVKMPGFAENPYAYMSRADVFVLSSVREGLPNVLIEAMACRVPVVSTDCPYGPREILEGGRFGKLVPVGEPRALADAIMDVLRHTPDTDIAYRRALDFSVDHCADEYLRVFRDLLG